MSGIGALNQRFGNLPEEIRRYFPFVVRIAVALFKPARLNDAEREVMKQHAAKGKKSSRPWCAARTELGTTNVHNAERGAFDDMA